MGVVALLILNMFKPIFAGFQATLFSLELIHSLDYFKTVEAALVDAYNKRMDEHAKEYDQTDPNEFIELIASESYEKEHFEAVIMRWHRYMYIVQSQVLFETLLAEVCAKLAAQRKVTFVLQQKAKLEQCGIFLKANSIAIPSQWDVLLKCRDVRDVIVHNNGTVKDTKREDCIRQQAASRKSKVKISINKRDEIVLDSEYCLAIGNHLCDFFNELFINVGWRSEHFSRKNSVPKKVK